MEKVGGSGVNNNECGKKVYDLYVHKMINIKVFIDLFTLTTLTNLY